MCIGFQEGATQAQRVISTVAGDTNDGVSLAMPLVESLCFEVMPIVVVVARDRFGSWTYDKGCAKFRL